MQNLVFFSQRNPSSVARLAMSTEHSNRLLVANTFSHHNSSQSQNVARCVRLRRGTAVDISFLKCSTAIGKFTAIKQQPFASMGKRDRSGWSLRFLLLNEPTTAGIFVGFFLTKLLEWITPFANYSRHPKRKSRKTRGIENVIPDSLEASEA